MILTDSSTAKIGATNVGTIASATSAFRQFMVYSATTLSSVISGTIGLIKNGTGALTLSGNNTYAGNAAINTGVLTITDLTALPGWNTNGRYSVESGATLAVYNAVTDANVITILGTTNFNAGSAIGFDTTSGNRAYPNVIANTAKGALGLTKLGSNTLTISGANTYTGPTLVIAGTLATSTANRIPDASAVTILSGATITLGGADTLATLAGAGTLTCGANALTLNSANSATFSGTLTNTAGTFTKTGSGVQTLSGSTTVAAQVRLDGGGIVSSGTFTQTAVAGARNFQIALNGGTTAALTVSSGTMTVTGLFFGENNGGSGTVNCNAGTLQVNGETWMTGLASILNVNGGTFNGSSYDIGGGGGTTTSIVNIISGTFALTGNLRWGIGGASATSIINLDGGTFRCNNWFRNGGTNTFNFNGGAFTTTTNNLTITQPLISFLIKSGGAVFGNAVTLIFDTVLANAPSVSGNLVMNGTGTLILRQANTFSGTITINAGSLNFGNGSTTGSAGSSSGITNNATLTFNRSNTMTQGTDFHVISGSGTAVQSGSGTTILGLSNSYTGETRINAGILQLGHAGGFGSGDIRFTGGTMRYGSGITTDVSSRIVNNSSDIRIDTNGQNVDFASLGSTNTGGLVKTGTGILTMSGSGNTYTGANTISVGGMTFSGTYTATNAVNINGAANPILNISGNFTQTFTGSGVRSFQLAVSSGNTGTVNVSGSAVVTLNGGMMLGDNNGGNGTFNQTGGTVSTSTSGTWLAGAVCLLSVSGGTFTTPGIECGGGTGAGTLTVSGTGTINSGSLILNRGTGASVSATLNLNGGNFTTTGISHVTTTNPATINFNGATFSPQNTMSIPTTVSTVVKSSGAIFNLPGASALTIAGALTDGTGGGGVTKQGTGTVNLNGTNTYTGATSILGGNIVVPKTNGGSTGTATFTNTTLSVSFNVAPTAGMTFRYFPGTTTQTYASVTLVGAPGRTATYNSANSTLTIA
jgi:fibronectin-binding autotransporter adhesin